MISLARRVARLQLWWLLSSTAFIMSNRSDLGMTFFCPLNIRPFSNDISSPWFQNSIMGLGQSWCFSGQPFLKTCIKVWNWVSFSDDARILSSFWSLTDNCLITYVHARLGLHLLSPIVFPVQSCDNASPSGIFDLFFYEPLLYSRTAVVEIFFVAWGCCT